MELIHGMFFLLMVAVFCPLFYVLDLIYRENKRKSLYVVLFPPYLLYYMFKNQDKTRNSTLLVIFFLGIISFVGFISAQPFGKEAVLILGKVFLWPVYLVLLYFNLM